MSEIRTSGDAASQQPGLPQERCDPLPGLIRSLREKQQKEQTERETNRAASEKSSD